MKKAYPFFSIVMSIALIVAFIPSRASASALVLGMVSSAPASAPVTNAQALVHREDDAAPPVGGIAEGLAPQKEVQPSELEINPFTRARILSQLAVDYTSYVYTHSDIILFAYEDGTSMQVYNSVGSLLWTGTLNAGQHQSLTPGIGVYLVGASKPFSINVGDALTDLVWGYYAVDQYGRGLSNLLYTYQADWRGLTQYDPHFVVFGYENNTQVQVKDTSSNQLIWSGTLNEGDHYSNSTLNNAFLTVSSSQPVSALSYTDQGYYIPASNTTFVGTKFYTYVGNSGSWSEDLNLIPYENSSVTVRNSTTGALIWSGILNVGQVQSISGINGTFVSIQSSGNIAASVSPFASWPGGRYYHSFYAQDSTGTGIGTQFTLPTTPTASDVTCRMILFSYNDNANVIVHDGSGTTVWSGILNQAASQVIYPAFTVYSISSSGEISVLLDCGDQAGADFAPVHYAVVRVNVTSPVGGTYYHGGSMLVTAGVSMQNVTLLESTVTGQIGLSAGAGEIKFAMNDAGINGDAVAGDGTYSANIILPGPNNMQPGNYYLYVSAHKEQGGNLLSGSGSTIFTLAGPSSGTLAVASQLTCPHSPDIFAGDTCTLSAAVTYPDASIHSDGSVLLTMFEPGHRQVPVNLVYAGSNLWQASYAFLQGGRYLLDIRANPAPATPYISGYGSLVEDVFATATPLQVSVTGLPATFQQHQMVNFTATVSAGGQPVSDATVTALVNPGLTNVDFMSLGNGSYAGLFFPDTAGSFSIDFQATSPLYKPGTAAAAFDVSAASANLLQLVQNTAGTTGTNLADLKNYTHDIAEDGDFFWSKLGPDKFQKDFDLIVNGVSLGTSMLDLAGELQKAALKSTAPVASRFTGVNLFDWMRDQADTSIDGRIFRSWATRLETSVQSGIFDQYLVLGQFPPNVGAGVLRRAGVYYASQMLAGTMDEVAMTKFNEYLYNQRNINSTFLQDVLYPIFARAADEDVSWVNDYANAILLAPPSVSQDLQDKLVQDLRSRIRANFSLVTDVRQRNVNLWNARDDREAQDNAPWYETWGLTLWKVATPILIGAACGGPVGAGVGVVITAGSLLYEWNQDSNNIGLDDRMHALAYGSMRTSLETAESLTGNSLSGLANVRKLASPEVPSGQIASINDISRGDQQLLWFSERQAVSSITIQNTGAYTADFNIRAYYERMSDWQTRNDTFWTDFMRDPLTGGTLGWVRLAPGASKTVEVVFKDKDQNNLDMRPNNGDSIEFVLIANTLNGIYFAESVYHDFNPVRQTVKGELLGAAAALPTISHPLATQVGKNASGLEYTIYLEVDNPMPYPISIKLEQGIPAGLAILSPNGGSVANNKIQWLAIVQPHDSAEFTYTVRNITANGSSVQVPAAVSSFFSPEAGADVQFIGAPVTIDAPTLQKAYLPVLYRDKGGPVYNWLDATSGGTIVAQGDDTYQLVSLPFAFNFYGNSYTELYVSTNGFVSFGSGYSNYSNSSIPSTSTPNNAIYAFWDDLTPSGGTNGNIYVRQMDSSTYVIEWYQVKQYGGAYYETFEIVLKSDNTITLQYQSMSNTGSATVGVENSTGTLAKQYLYNGSGAPLTNLLAIRYTTP